MLSAALLHVVVLMVLSIQTVSGQGWQDLQKQAIVSEKASAIAASKVEYYKKKRDLKNAILWMKREKKQYQISQKTIEAAALAHPVPNKETATAQVVIFLSGSGWIESVDAGDCGGLKRCVRRTGTTSETCSRQVRKGCRRNGRKDGSKECRW